MHQFLDSLVVRISACHVEGPGSIPGRGVTSFCRLSNYQAPLYTFLVAPQFTEGARVAQSVER